MSCQTSARKPPERPPVYNFSPPANESKPKIIGFSGKIGAGKDSCANFIHALAFVHALQLTPQARIDDNGKIVVLDSENNEHVFDIDSKDSEVVDFLAQRVWPFIRKFSCAEPLKNFCIDVLGLSVEQVWGTQEEKSGVTHLFWENMPVPVYKVVDNKEDIPEGFKITKEVSGKSTKVTCKKFGFMTSREVMEYFGSEIIRKMHSDAWANALIKFIDKLNPTYALVSDVRFPNEVRAIQQSGGKVIRLTRITEEASVNTHISNTALDDYEGFDAVIDNQNLTMDEMFGKLMQILMDFEWFAEVPQ